MKRVLKVEIHLKYRGLHLYMPRIDLPVTLELLSGWMLDGLASHSFARIR